VLTADRYLDHIDSEGQALAAAARSGGVHEECPTCPGWKVDRLLGHVGSVHQWAAETVRRQATESVDSRSLPRPPGGEENIGWFEEKWHALVETLRGADPESETWNFTDAPRKTHFWFRRMAHETAMHRVDAELAAGRTPTPIPTELAVDGIDEFLDHMIMMRGNPGEHLQGSIHLHATDVPEGSGGEWTIVLSPDGATVTREHGKGDVAVRASASDLLMLIMNRRSAEGLEIFGDASLLEQWKEYVKF